VGLIGVAEIGGERRPVHLASGVGALADEAAVAALAAVEANAELFRQYKGFAEPVPVPSMTAVLDRALALSGRDPHWTASRG
jgi:hypothetical protein